MMLRLFVFSLLAVVVTANVENVASNSSCGADLNMTRLGEKSYYFELDKKKLLDWESVQQFCQSHGLQMNTIENEEENKLLTEYIKERIPEEGGWFFWLAGKFYPRERREGDSPYFPVNGVWRWTSTGQKLNYTDWSSGYEPTHVYNDWSCMMMWVFTDGRADWVSYRCETTLRFVCEKKRAC